jgi:formate/nitrite transporter FocA (FNT family)
MSSEQIKIDTLEIPKVIDSNITSRVDINQLIAKAREKERKENKLNYILLSIAGSIILSIALTLSL